MTVTREQVMNALLTTIQGMTFGTPINTATTWVTTARRLALWTKVPPDLQPAAYLVEHEENDNYQGVGLLRRRLVPKIWCYVPTNDLTVVGGTLLNTLLESFEAAFAPDDPGLGGINSFTLGGLVYWCRIEGRIFLDPGDIDNQALMIVPLVIEMP